MSQFIEMFGNPLSSKQKNELKRLGQCCIINPRRPNIALCDTDKVSFIPMPAVSEDGYLVDMADEEYGKVKKGFTYFENNDVLFAKITPCMENGKGAIAYGLTNGIGVGSTEFHVLRPINGISSPYWLLTLTRMPIFRERAAKNMSGTGGQKRVSASYLNHFMVGLPAIEEQRRFEAIYRQADKSKFGDFKSQFIEMFGTVENNTHNFPIMTIGEFANCFAGATPSTSHPEYWENGRIRWMSSGEVHKGHVEDTDSRITELGYKSASTRMVPIHSIVIAIAGQGKTRGTVAITEVDLCTNQSLCAIVPDERVNYSYLYHNLQGRYLELRGLSGDVNGRGGLNLKIIQKIPVILPPIEKQQQFASIAQQADKSKFGDFKSQFIEMYYNTHNKQTLESVCPIMSKGITPKYVESSSVLVINQACIHWDGQRLGNIKYHNEEIPVRKRILESGDVLLNATGNGTLGRCCVFICPSDNNTYINDGHVIALSTDRAVILPEVLNTYLSLNDTQAEIYRQYVTGSTNQVDIVFSDIKKMKVPVPSMDEQILFVEVLKQADKSKSVIQKALVYLNDIQSDELRKIA